MQSLTRIKISFCFLHDWQYEVTERGWGEFDAQIRIHWKDPNEKPTLVRSELDKAAA